MPSQFVINVKDLESGARDYVFPLSAQWLAAALQDCDVDPGPAGDGRLEVRATLIGTDVRIQGSVRTNVVATCGRCLEPAPVAIDVRFEILMVRRAGLDPKRFEEEDDADWEAFDGDRIVLDDLCREQILLDVPMNPLCSPDCAGIPFAAPDKN